MESSQEEAEAKLESLIENFDLKQHVLILEFLLEVAELQWKKTKYELEDVQTEWILKGDEKSPEYLASKIELMRDKAKVECLLEQMKSVQDEGKLESEKWKMRLSENIEKAEFILQEMKSMLEKRLGASGLEMQLEEQIAKSELLLEEMILVGVLLEEEVFGERSIDVAVKSPLLKMQLNKQIVKVESLLENMKFVHEESKEDTVELKFLLREMKLALESGKVKSSSLTSSLESYVVKLKLLLDATELEKEKEGLGCQMLEIELLEELIKEGFVLMKYVKRLPIIDWEERHLVERILSILREMKSEHKGEGLKPQVLEVILEQKEKEEHATTSKPPQEKMRLVQEESNIKSPMQEESNIKSPTLGMQLKECIVELDGVLKIGKLKSVRKKLKFRKLKTQLHRHIVELEPLLEKTKLEEKEEGKRFGALKMELNEDMAQLELLLEETELEERHVAEIKRFTAKTNKINLIREESTMESFTLQLEERKVEFQSLLNEMKAVCFFQDRYKMDMRREMMKLEFLLEGIMFKQNEQGLQSQGLKIQLVLELLMKEIESTRDVKILGLKGHLEKVKFLLRTIKLEREEEKLEFPALKMQLKESTVQIESQRKLWKMECLYEKALEKQLHERIEELKSLQEKIELAQMMENLKCRLLEMELNRHMMELRSAPQVSILSFSSIERELENHTQNSKWLLEKMESERDAGILQPLVWKIILDGYSAKRMYHKLKIEFKQHMAKVESLLLEMKLEQEEEGPGFKALKIALEEYIVKLELLLKERELICDVDILKSPESKIRLDEHLGKVKSRLATIKLGFPELKEHIVHLKSVLKEMKSEWTEAIKSSGASAVDVELKEDIVNLDALLAAAKLEPKKERLEASPKKIRLEQEGGKVGSLIEERPSPTSLMALRPLIVIGGRGQEGQSLRSVEGYIFHENRWIAFPAMNIPRSFASSVVVGNEIVVSGGDTGPAITDTIEVLNLAEAPLQWRMSPARLPVPLSAHQTVVYKERLIVIGGHDGNEGRNSDTIYEILLAAPYTSRILLFMPIPVAWHGAELMGDAIFIFGGGRSHSVTTSNVFVYNLVRNTLNERQSLPRALKGMATVRQEQSVAVVGGLDSNDQELNEVFMYDTRSGGRRSLPQMSEERGGCTAAISIIFDTSGFTDALFVLGSMRSLNTVEGYSFGSHRWIDMPPTSEAREFCSMVIAPIELPLG